MKIILFVIAVLLVSINIQAKEPYGEEQFFQYQKTVQKQFDHHRYKINQNWEAYTVSSSTRWVEYNNMSNTRSIVDFKNGSIFIEAIVQADTPDSFTKAKEMIRTQAQIIFSQTDDDTGIILENQVRNKKGVSVSRENINTFLNTEIFSHRGTAFVRSKKDHQIKYQAKINLQPDHLNIRAKRYLPFIARYAKQYNIDPGLVMAIIQAESSFNPKAISNCGAIGLMQIVPNQAGKEASQFVLNKKKTPSKAFLMNPSNNIQLGCAYLYLLKNRYFGKIKNEQKQRYSMICSFNWGPTIYRRKILNKYNVKNISSDAFYHLLIKKVPPETSLYLKKVNGRMSFYKYYFLQAGKILNYQQINYMAVLFCYLKIHYDKS